MIKSNQKYWKHLTPQSYNIFFLVSLREQWKATEPKKEDLLPVRSLADSQVFGRWGTKASFKVQLQKIK